VIDILLTVGATAQFGPRYWTGQGDGSVRRRLMQDRSCKIDSRRSAGPCVRAVAALQEHTAAGSDALSRRGHSIAAFRVLVLFHIPVGDQLRPGTASRRSELERRSEAYLTGCESRAMKSAIVVYATTSPISCRRSRSFNTSDALCLTAPGAGSPPSRSR
jgi:hypothetical protein